MRCVWVNWVAVVLLVTCLSSATPAGADPFVVVQSWSQGTWGFDGPEDHFYFYDSATLTPLNDFGAGSSLNGIADVCFDGKGHFAALDRFDGGTQTFMYDVLAGSRVPLASTGTSWFREMSGLVGGDFVIGGAQIVEMVKVHVDGSKSTIPDYGTNQYDLTSMIDGRVAMLDSGPVFAANRNIRTFSPDFSTVTPEGPATDVRRIDARGLLIAGLAPSSSLVRVFDDDLAELTSFPIATGSPIDVAWIGNNQLAVLYEDLDQVLVYDGAGHLDGTLNLPFDVTPDDRLAGVFHIPEPGGALLIVVGVAGLGLSRAWSRRLLPRRI